VLDTYKIRKDFPILNREVYNKPLVYLDNAATTQKPICVIKKMEEIYSTINSNIHRGVHHLSRLATESHEQARKTVAGYINAHSDAEVIFTRGTTDAINLVASSFCRSHCKSGDEIIVTAMEHHANIVPWQLQAEQVGVVLRVLPVNGSGEIKTDDLEQLISPQTKLISVAHVSNVTGIVNPVEDIIRIAHGYGIPVMIDAAQSVQHMKIDVEKMDCDFLVFSSHKMYGPLGIGVLYGKEQWLDSLPPYQGGGEMIARVSFEGTTFNELPFKFEAGTPDYVGSAALGEAIGYITEIGMDNVRRYEEELSGFAIEQLLQIEGVKLVGTAERKSPVISFLLDEIHPYDAGMLLDRMGFALRTGHHCAQPLMDALGIDGTIRASFAFYNTKDEIVQFVDAVKKVMNILVKR
jgi:cysteine desulfurase/selenocysteine lyase